MFVNDAKNCWHCADPDDNSGQTEIVNVDPDNVRDTDTMSPTSGVMSPGQPPETSSVIVIASS